MYQIFEEVSVAGESGERVKALQREFKAWKLKGFLVPHSDEHQNEFLSPSAERLAWLTKPAVSMLPSGAKGVVSAAERPNLPVKCLLLQN